MVTNLLKRHGRRLLFAIIGSLLGALGIHFAKQRVTRRRVRDVDYDEPLVREDGFSLPSVPVTRRRKPGGAAVSTKIAREAAKSERTLERGATERPRSPINALADALRQNGLTAFVLSKAGQPTVVVRDEAGARSANAGAVGDVLRAIGANAVQAGYRGDGNWQVVKAMGEPGNWTAIVRVGEQHVTVRVVDPAVYRSMSRSSARDTGRDGPGLGIHRNLR